MKAYLASTLLFIFLAAGTHAQQASTATFEQKRAASSQAVMVKYPEAADPHSRLSDIALEIVRDWKAKQDWRLTTPDLPMYLWDAAAIQLRVEKESADLRDRQAAIAAQYEAQKADIQRQLEIRLAQIRATSYVTPSPTPAPRAASPPPAKTGVTVISGANGVYTTHGGAAGGATIIQTVPGHFEIRTKGQPTQRVIVTSP